MKLATVYRSALALTLGVAVLGSTLALSRSDYSFFDPLIEVKDIINRRYVEKPDEKTLQLGAINGLVESLNDPYTTYVPPSSRREFEKELTGEYVGIGVVVESREGWLTVVTPMEDSAAAKAGILADDRILEVEGVSTFRRTPDECVDLMIGKAGEPVKVIVERGGNRIPLSIVREDVVVRTVKGFHWDQEDGGKAGRWRYTIDPGRRIAYIRLTQFTPGSVDDLRQALNDLGAAEGRLGGLVLDLRFNPGGVLDGAVAIADMFIKEGVIVSTKGRSFPDEVARARDEGTLPDFPLAVLVNGQSASASEVLSGALQDDNRAIIVGTRTFGKGLVQSVLPVPGVPGGQLKVTQQRYYLPSGRCIQRTDDSAQWGVDPSPGFYVPLTDQETIDMFRVRRSEDILKAQGPDGAGPSVWSDPDAIAAQLKDKQLAAAVKAVQARIDQGRWVPTGADSPAGTELAGKELSRTELLRDRIEKELDRLDRKIESLRALAASADQPPAKDLWPEASEPVGGHVVVTDKDGKVVARLRITGEGLERWLLESPVEPDPGR